MAYRERRRCWRQALPYPDFFIGAHADPLFSMWRLAWVAHQLPRDPLALYDANMFWPERATLANSGGMPLAGRLRAITAAARGSRR